MRKTIRLIILLILTLVTLTGCAQLNYEVEIKSNGSGEIAYVYGISKNVLNSLNISVDEFVSEMKEQAQESNYQVETYEDDKLAGFKASKHIDNLNEEFSLHEAFTDYVTDTDENGIKIKKGLFTTNYSQIAELDLSTISEEERSYVTMTYQIKLPTKVATTNANEVSEDGKILKWNLTAGEINKIEFTAKGINKLPIMMIALVLIAAVVIFIILKKKHTTNKEQ